MLIELSQENVNLDDLSVWDTEQGIEALEQQGITQELHLPSASLWTNSGIPKEQLWHLEMFLRIRGAGSPDRSSFCSLEARSHEVGLGHFRSLIGSPNPGILLLGDRHNPNNDPWYWAAFGPWAGSGLWLLESLLTLGFATRSTLALANAMEENVGSLVRELNPDSVVALGRSAQARCRKAGIEPGVVPHPQYARRFLNRQREGYAQLIERVAESGEDMGSWRGTGT